MDSNIDRCASGLPIQQLSVRSHMYIWMRGFMNGHGGLPFARVCRQKRQDHNLCHSCSVWSERWNLAHTM